MTFSGSTVHGIPIPLFLNQSQILHPPWIISDRPSASAARQPTIHKTRSIQEEEEENSNTVGGLEKLSGYARRSCYQFVAHRSTTSCEGALVRGDQISGIIVVGGSAGTMLFVFALSWLLLLAGPASAVTVKYCSSVNTGSSNSPGMYQLAVTGNGLNSY